MTFFLQALGAGASRGQLAALLISNDKYRNYELDRIFFKWLHRYLFPHELNYWTNLLQQGFTLAQINELISCTDEAFLHR